ncbi:ribosomal RNA small subunit methyltransferase H [Clostridia bacterium]|nr:ribosomal RNA small subunit methyltransferase H [Clostridia bacterium]
MTGHIPVMLGEVLEYLTINPEGFYIDATYGRGGHYRAIAERLTTGRIIGIDQDHEASGDIVRENFRNLRAVTQEPADGILFDLGVSSPQLDDAERGFSFHRDARLDMRMDQTQELSAWEIVNMWDAEAIAKILTDYGEERYSRRIVERIVRERPINTTLELAEAVKRAMPAKALREERHPAMRTFQGLRIAVNDELNALTEGLTAAIDLLKPGGRVALITFHSLEDRIVKRIFNARADGCTCPPDFPVCVCGFRADLRIITRKPVTAGAEECKANPRSHSAKLRVAQKI